MVGRESRCRESKRCWRVLSVQKVVKPEGLREFCASDDWPEVSAHKIPEQDRRSLAGSEYEIIVLIIRAFLQSAFSLFPSVVREVGLYHQRGPASKSWPFGFTAINYGSKRERNLFLQIYKSRRAVHARCHSANSTPRGPHA